MLSQYFKSPSHVQLLLSRPGGPLLEGFSQYLEQLGYAKSSICTRIAAASHFLCWANREGIPLPSFNELTLERFAEHLSRCQCQGFGHQRRIVSLRGARMFLTYQGGISTRAIGFTALAADLESVQFFAFCQWMRQQRGTSDATLYNHGIALRDLFRRGDDLGKLNAMDLRQFILEQSMKKGWAAAKHCTTALRMLVRFLIAEGKCAAGLEAAIPVLAHWSLSTLPRYLQLDEVERVIASCDTASPVGQRDRAILLLLARLGLRAGDIWHLRIGDIDWKDASISVSGKNGRQTLLPLTQEVGQAIVDYLRQGRPRTDTDTVFVRACAPFQAFANHAAISIIVKKAMRRAGVVCSSRGAAHVLRHSVATSMLGQGASLQDIAAVLRHQSVATTQIYAKVDIAALRQIAQPWPEELPC
ncbi:Tyrosine-type recombinase/integrase (plasmid) [Cupriavidus necator H16]|uniref:Integrase n=1 Tax=Cupriavidus necator (strain ATCC 17699 / DSM 428 / KCTC 22496 / NCIMB 10442 / H16 / Stanier 337) TaxID=381666 RepID=Q7WXS0_CUPNH|nr:site-specific integrase [Cupriavidus necator]AAP85801.1 putative integrase/recombinase [Cupriavidus necator H16]QCC05324.1 integrase [Cupriavidus necator H16]QQB81495.1 tyrosine-type recombinase/integrase [Cupriavidus necator]